jgi:CRP-like cAMP-binding protein
MRRGITQQRMEVLRAIPLFQHCSTRELAKIDALIDDIEADPGETLVREGNFGQESFVIVAGEAAVTVHDEEVARLGPGDFFGEMALLAKKPFRVATVTACTPMHLLVVEPQRFNELLEIGTVATTMLKGVVERLSSLEGRPA